MISISLEHDGKFADLDFPCREKDLQAALDSIGVDQKKSHCMPINDVLDPVELSWLELCAVDLDELNFLSKRMEHMTPEQLPEFFAASKYEGKHNLKDLINLTYNLNCYTLISDMSDIRSVGRKYMSTVKPTLSPEAWATMDFSAVGRRLMNSGKGVITEYGIVFRNEDIPMNMVYDGTTFPKFDYKGNSLIHVSLCYGDQRESVFLPTEVLALDKAAKRLGAPSLSKCDAHLLDFGVDNPKWIERFRTMLKEDGLIATNLVANAIDTCDVNLDKLSAVMKYAGVDSPADIVKLVDRSSSFTFIPKAKTYREMGEYYIAHSEEFRLHPQMEMFFDYEGFGKYLANNYEAVIVPGGIVAMSGDLTLDEILEREPTEAVQMGEMKL